MTPVRALLLLAALAVAGAALAAHTGGSELHAFDGTVNLHRVERISLVADDGRHIAVGASLNGTIVVFGYTRCTDECPLTLARVAVALTKLPAAKRPSAYFVTVDPAHDDPGTLHRYLASWDHRITGLTGEPSDLRRLARELGLPGLEVRYETHDTRIFLLTAAGDVQRELSPEASSAIIACAVTGLR
jgi:protein SCO1/2